MSIIGTVGRPNKPLPLCIEVSVLEGQSYYSLLPSNQSLAGSPVAAQRALGQCVLCRSEVIRQ